MRRAALLATLLAPSVAASNPYVPRLERSDFICVFQKDWVEHGAPLGHLAAEKTVALMPKTPEDCEEERTHPLTIDGQPFVNRKCEFMPPPRHAEIAADLGLSVIQAGYEQPIGRHYALAVTAGLFGTYFLPWFDLGDKVIGVGGGVRGTWFARETGRGFYIAPYVRAHRVSGDHDGMHGTGLGFSAGAFAGWAFALGSKLDLRLGVGAQFIRQHLDAPASSTSSTPFVALDLFVGYRL